MGGGVGEKRAEKVRHPSLKGTTSPFGPSPKARRPIYHIVQARPRHAWPQDQVQHPTKGSHRAVVGLQLSHRIFRILTRHLCRPDHTGDHQRVYQCRLSQCQDAKARYIETRLPTRCPSSTLPRRKVVHIPAGPAPSAAQPGTSPKQADL